MRASQSMLEPVRRASEDVADFIVDRPRRGIIGLIVIALIVAFGIWAWPEMKRTIHIHRM